MSSTTKLSEVNHEELAEKFRKMRQEEHEYRKEMSRRKEVEKVLTRILDERTEKVNKLLNVPEHLVQYPRVALLSKKN